MIYNELEKLYPKAWEEKLNYLYFDTSKQKNEGRHCVCNESKNAFSKCTLKQIIFDLW